jgi:hypothetical protein
MGVDRHSQAGQSAKPLLFLDVDGVLNAFGNEEYPRFETEGGPCWVPEPMKDRVHRLLEVFDPYWATAWRGGAHRVWAKLLDLDPMPWPYVNYRQWKLTEIVKAAGWRRWAWVDDDAEWELRGLRWTREQVPGLIVVPDPNHGLTDAHVDELIAWANA